MTTSNTNHNILKHPIIKAGVDYASRIPVCIDLLSCDLNGDDKKVGTGSGFFLQRDGFFYLITNWHILTGRSPQKPEFLLDNYPASPSGFQIHLASIENPSHFIPSKVFPLYIEGKPQWLETSISCLGVDERIDLVAIKFEFSPLINEALITTIENFAPSGKDFMLVGNDVVIIGYPFGLSSENPYPIWKRGYVASEPSILIGGMPKYFIDTPGRPGMSGSPVFMISKGMAVSAKTHELLKSGNGKGALEVLGALNMDELTNARDVNILRFAGVYSGSVGDSSLEQLRVGVAWHAAMVDRLFTHSVEGSNPYPPYL
jgi:hypothetical protein